jgi:DNA invertase Pin-like site-specific DNA recombinase
MKAAIYTRVSTPGQAIKGKDFEIVGVITYMVKKFK